MKFIIYSVLLVCCLIETLILSEKVDSRCTEEFCEKFRTDVKCRESNAYCRKHPNSTRFPYPDVCNCCDYCLRNLEEGESCIVGSPGFAAPLEICGPGLQCTKNQRNSTCEKIRGPCNLAQEDFDKRKKEGNVGKTEVRPQCDGDGLFKPVHCIPGSICYCVEPLKGTRIFGELPYLDYEDQEKMTCGCSLNDWKAKNTLDPAYPPRVARCTNFGTFDSLQCMMGSNATCLCIDPLTGSPNTSIDTVTEENIRENNPSCFDVSKHTIGRYNTECEMEYESSIADAKDKKRIDICSLKSEICDPDGKYSRILCSGFKKVCVDPDGRQIDHYEAETNSEAGKNMDCNCARTRWLLNKAGVVELPECCSNGNYEAWQCRRNECYCIDKNGDQCGMEVSKTDVSKLKCYDEGGPCRAILSDCKTLMSYVKDPKAT